MTAPLTDADLAAARALAEGATPGPWHPRGSPGFIRCESGDIVASTLAVGSTTPDAIGDAAFIAAARTLVPRLCDAVEEARRERDELRAELEETEDDRRGLLKTLECVTCKGSLMAPLQCAHCIETERIPEGMPQRPVTAVLRLRAEVADLQSDVELHKAHWTAAREERDKIRAWLCEKGYDAEYERECDVPGCPKAWESEVADLRARLARVVAAGVDASKKTRAYFAHAGKILLTVESRTAFEANHDAGVAMNALDAVLAEEVRRG